MNIHIMHRLKMSTGGLSNVYSPQEIRASPDNCKGGRTRPQSEARGGRGSRLQQPQLFWRLVTDICDLMPGACFAHYQKPQSKQSTETATLIISINTPSHCYSSISMIYSGLLFYSTPIIWYSIGKKNNI